MEQESKRGSSRKADHFKNSNWLGLDLINESTRPNTGTFLSLKNMLLNNNGKLENRKGFREKGKGPDQDILNTQGFVFYKKKTPNGYAKELFVVKSGVIYKNTYPVLTVWEKQEQLISTDSTDTKGLAFQTTRPVQFSQIDRFLLVASGSGIFVYDGDNWKDSTTSEFAFIPTDEQKTALGYNIAHPEGINASRPLIPEGDGVPSITSINMTSTQPGGLTTEIPINIRVGYKDVIEYKTIFLGDGTRSDVRYAGSPPEAQGFSNERTLKIEDNILDTRLVLNPAIIFYSKSLSSGEDPITVDTLQYLKTEFINFGGDSDIQQTASEIINGFVDTQVTVTLSGEFTVEVMLAYVPRRFGEFYDYKHSWLDASQGTTLETKTKTTSYSSSLIAGNTDYTDTLKTLTNSDTGFAQKAINEILTPNDFFYSQIKYDTTTTDYVSERSFDIEIAALSKDVLNSTLSFYYNRARAFLDNVVVTDRIQGDISLPSSGSVFITLRPPHDENSKFLVVLDIIDSSRKTSTIVSKDALVVSDKLTSDDIKTCNLVEIYKGRFYLAGSLTFPRTIFSSDVINLDYFGSFISTAPTTNKYEPFNLLKSRRNTLMIPSDSEFSLLDGDGLISAEGLDFFRASVLYPGVGVIAPRTLKFVDNNLIYLSNDGVRFSKPNTFDENSILTIKRIDKTIQDFVRIDREAIAFFTDGRYYLMYSDGVGLIFDFDHGSQWSSFETQLKPFKFHLEDEGVNFFINDLGDISIFDRSIYKDIELNSNNEEVELPIKFELLPNAFSGNTSLDNVTKVYKRMEFKFKIRDDMEQEFKVNLYVNGVDISDEKEYTLIKNSEGSLSVESQLVETFLRHSGHTVVGTWVLGKHPSASYLPGRSLYQIKDYQINPRNGDRAAKGEAITFSISGEATEKFEFLEFSYGALIRKRRKRVGTVYGERR